MSAADAGTSPKRRKTVDAFSRPVDGEAAPMLSSEVCVMTSPPTQSCCITDHIRGSITWEVDGRTRIRGGPDPPLLTHS